MLLGLNTQEARDLVLSVGTHHGKRRLSPVEVAHLFEKALFSGATLRDCADFVGLTGTTMVSRFLRLLKLNPAIQHIVDWGQTNTTLSFDSASKVAQLNESDHESVVEEIIANRMNKNEVRELVQLRERSKRPISDCVAEVLRMRPVIERQYVFLGAVTDRRLEEALSGLQQRERDELLGATLRAIYGPIERISGRLGTKRFLIVTDSKGAECLRRDGPDAFEAALNSGLAARILKE